MFLAPIARRLIVRSALLALSCASVCLAQPFPVTNVIQMGFHCSSPCFSGPPTQNLTVTSSTGANGILQFTASASVPGILLNGSSSVQLSTPTTITVSIDPKTAPGNGQIILESNENPTQQFVLVTFVAAPVIMLMCAPPNLQATVQNKTLQGTSSTNLALQYNVGNCPGETAPPDPGFSISLFNAAGPTTSNWLTPSETSGAVPNTVTLDSSANLLPPGLYKQVVIVNFLSNSASTGVYATAEVDMNVTITPPSLSTITPFFPTAGATPETISVTGSNFESGFTVTITSPDSSTTTLSGSQIQNATTTSFQMMAVLQSTGGYSFVVTNPDGGVSSPFFFTVIAAQPLPVSVSSINPTTPTANASPQAISVSGTNFESGLMVALTAPNATTTTLSSFQIANVSSGSFQMNVVLSVAGAYSFQVENPDGGTSARFSFIVAAAAPTTTTQVLPDFAVGGSFVTDFYVVNSGASAANFSISFHNQSGNPVALPFAGGVGSQSTLSGSIPGGGAAFYEAGTPQESPALSGSAVISADPAITVQALFRRLTNGIYYEAAVPATSGSNEFLVPFDATVFSGNSDQIFTGLAIANMDTSNVANVSCIARDSTGTVIPNAISVPTLNPLGQWADYLFPPLAGLRGTFDCTSNTLVGAIGIRALGTNALSSLPVVTLPVASSSALEVLPDFAVGASFVTDIYAISSDAVTQDFTMSFNNSQGQAVALPFAGGVGTQSSLSPQLPGGGAAFFEAGTPGGSPISGSALVNAVPQITVQALFRRLTNGVYYEAAVPATAGSNEFLVPFDATVFSGNGDQIFTGLAIANLDGSNVANVSCIARDSAGNVIPGAISVPALNPFGQWADYLFPALTGLRGTFDCTSNTLVGAIGIRALGTNALSSLPVITIQR